MVCLLSLLALCSFLAQPLIGLGTDNAAFWIVTDLHVDAFYDVQGIGDSKHQCHKGNSTSKSKPLGHFGNHHCDSPPSLAESALDAMKTFDPNPDFILWLGDSVSHAYDYTSSINTTGVYVQIGETLKNIRKRFPKVRIYPALGNHDNKISQLMPVNNPEFYSNYLNLSNWNTLITSEPARKTFLKGGYYSLSIKQELKLIMLNTILWIHANTLTKNISDPADQFQWLEQQLAESRKQKQKVMMAAHAPPGFWEQVFQTSGKTNSYLHAIHNKKIIDVIVKYCDIISTQLYTHTHSNSFRLFLKNDMPVSTAVTSSSVSPNYGVTPSIKHFTMDLKKAMIEKYRIYFMELTKANQLYAKNHSIDINSLWKLAIDSSSNKTGFHLKNITTRSLVSLYNNILQNSNTFTKYLFSNMAPYHKDHEPLAYVQNACAIKYVRIDDYRKCVKELKNITSRAAIYEKLRITFTTPAGDHSGGMTTAHQVAIGVAAALLIVLAVVPIVFLALRRNRLKH